MKKNRDIISNKAKGYYKNNRDVLLNNARVYYKNNKELINERARSLWQKIKNKKWKIIKRNIKKKYREVKKLNYKIAA